LARLSDKPCRIENVCDNLEGMVFRQGSNNRNFCTASPNPTVRYRSGSLAAGPIPEVPRMAGPSETRHSWYFSGTAAKSPIFAIPAALRVDRGPMNECRKLGTRKSTGNGDLWVHISPALPGSSDHSRTLRWEICNSESGHPFITMMPSRSPLSVPSNRAFPSRKSLAFSA